MTKYLTRSTHRRKFWMDIVHNGRARHCHGQLTSWRWELAAAAWPLSCRSGSRNRTSPNTYIHYLETGSPSIGPTSSLLWEFSFCGWRLSNVHPPHKVPMRTQSMILAKFSLRKPVSLLYFLTEHEWGSSYRSVDPKASSVGTSVLSIDNNVLTVWNDGAPSSLVFPNVCTLPWDPEAT